MIMRPVGFPHDYASNGFNPIIRQIGLNAPIAKLDFANNWFECTNHSFGFYIRLVFPQPIQHLPI